MSMKSFVLSILTDAFGEYWYVFISYMVFNILDWVTGSLKAMKLRNVSSYLGLRGLLKKLGCWIVIGLAFSFSSMFVIISREVLGVNLSIMYSLGWFTFLLLIVNEIVSILENLVVLNVKVPDILMKSLKLTDNILDDVSKKILDKDSEESSKKK
ncbi:phage holin family protein [Anaerosporobacter sp.]|uniref:phage holin family protein n=1 Tax=Anaerosporobacter sp. TaxID=1872529 RepID=UPI00286EC47F|nr:phage holin family protein [Anaerosporobacter sp.]